MNFEDIQKNWQSQSVNIPADDADFKKELQTRWQKHQRKVLLRNIFLTVSFAVVFVVIGWVYIAFNKQYGWPFAVSIGTMYILLAVFLWVSWRGYAFKTEYLDIASNDYIGYQLQKLNWQRKIITTYTVVYSVLLWLMLMMYTVEVTKHGSATFRFTALGVTTAYVLGVTLWSRFTRQKKRLARLDEMIVELKGIKEGMD